MELLEYDKLYDIFLFDMDTGECVGTKLDVEESMYKALAGELHFEDRYAVKVYENTSGNVVYTLGM